MNSLEILYPSKKFSESQVQPNSQQKNQNYGNVGNKTSKFLASEHEFGEKKFK